MTSCPEAPLVHDAVPKLEHVLEALGPGKTKMKSYGHVQSEKRLIFERRTGTV